MTQENCNTAGYAAGISDETTDSQSLKNKDYLPLEKQVSEFNPAFKYLGFSLLLAFHYVVWFNPDSFLSTNLLSEKVTIAWLCNLVGTSLCMIAISLALGRSKRIQNQKLTIVMPLLLFVMALAQGYLAPIIGEPLLLYVCAAISGILEGFILILWGECLVQSRAKFSVFHIGAMFGCTLFAAMVISLLMPPMGTPFFGGLLVLISGALLTSQSKRQTEQPVPLLPKEVSKTSFKTIVTVSAIAGITSIACYYLTAIIPWEVMPTGLFSFTLGVFVAAVLILLVSVFSSLFKDRATIFRMFPYYLVLVIISYALFITSQDFYFPAFLGVLCVSSLLEVSLIMYFGILTQRGFIAPATAFTYSVVSARFGIFLGNGLALFYEFNPSIAEALTEPTALIFICILAILLIPMVKRENNIVELTREPVKPAEIDTICREIALQFKLSEREAEILKLLAKGNTANGVANKLVISPHTVNTHIRHIYEKVGIHKRNELLEYINMRKSDNS